jgi:hypothetical protein
MDSKIICISSSIENWKDKILKRYNGIEYQKKHTKDPVIFFGLYKKADYDRFLAHKGERTVVWCGSDILQTGQMFRTLQKIPARHIAENEIQAGVLKLMLQTNNIEIRYNFLSDPKDFPLCYKRSDRPHVFMHINYNAEPESGWYTIEEIAPELPKITFHIYGNMEPREAPKNIVFHGYVPEEQFNKEIRWYQAGLRLHEFDGFSEIISKSILLGQHPISRIRYPKVSSYNDKDGLVALLSVLKARELPNPSRAYYLQEFRRPL